jgi:hypothetical protein
MRLVPKPGGTPQEFRALLISQPFDLAWAEPIIPSGGDPETTFKPGARGSVFASRVRGSIFTAPVRGQTWLGRESL